ncbi:SGNH/GDSL hydrolase family protein [Aurantibacter sp.]|uniref:SGNH/GDSL hydrolase family protein n=1 Tax=Aurantibacter sp. TaxID=2807103 RepID=UPI003266DF07
MKLKYIGLLGLLIGFNACNEPEDVIIDFEGEQSEDVEVQAPALTAGSANFSTYVAVGNSLTAGYTDGALFKAAQENSLTNMLANKFALVGGGDFTQPLMNDNFGGLLAGGGQIQETRFVFNGTGPQRLIELNPGASPTTDIFVNNPTGPFNNMGVPGAKAIHMVFQGYGNPGNLPDASPYFIRMTGATPNASVLEMAMAQNPTFFTLWAGNNDVLGYATTGGDGTNPITPKVQFDGAIGALVGGLTSGGAQGVVANIPYVSTIPHFTTVPFNPLDPANPEFAPQIPTLNSVFGAINQVFTALGETDRIIEFSETEASGVVILDENLDDLTVQIAGALGGSAEFKAFVVSLGLPEQASPLVAGLLGQTYGQARQATAADLLVLPSSSFIATIDSDNITTLMGQGLPANLAGQFSANGVTLPLGDKWVLTPEEQAELKTATDEFNATIKAAADGAGLAFVDANALMQEIASSGYADGDFILTSDLVTGGAFSLDGVHPTAKGYAVLANQFLMAIDATYGSNFESSESLLNVIDYPTNYSASLQ